MSATSASVPSQISSAPSASISVTYPPCAGQCLSDATTSLPCDASDSTCLCLHASNVQKSVTSCLAKSNACSSTDATAAADYYNELCASLNLPTTSINAAATEPIATASGSPTGIPSNFVTSTSPSSTSAASAVPSDSSSNNPLNVPTIAGIAAGAAFILVALITGLVYIYIRRQNSPPSYSDSEKASKSLPPPPPSSTTLAGEQKRKSSTVSTESSSSTSTASRHQKRHPRYSSRHISVSSTKDLETTVTTKALPTSSSGTTLASIPSPHPSNTTTKSKKNKTTKSTQQQSLPPPLSRPSIPHSQNQRPDSPLAHARFAFGAKRAAEASVTSLSLPVPGTHQISTAAQLHSPATTEFSDVGSVYSGTAETVSMVGADVSPLMSRDASKRPSKTHSFRGSISEVSSVASLEIESWRLGGQRSQLYGNEAEGKDAMSVERRVGEEMRSFSHHPPTGGGASAVLYQHPGAVVSSSSSSSSAAAASATTRPKPAALQIATTREMLSDNEQPTVVDIDAERRKSLLRWHPLAQHPSPRHDQTNFKFEFDLPSPASMQDFRNSMMGSLNFDFGDEVTKAEKRKSQTLR